MGQQEDEIKKCKQTITDLHMKILQQQQEMIEYVKASGIYSIKMNVDAIFF